ncbi:glycosyltransferase family 39 protein [Mycobacterium sp. SVM_VP21]|nr:glycosyltransferase family 39 protein [Mycobacterium sp. SVM_VP21]
MSDPTSAGSLAVTQRPVPKMARLPVAIVAATAAAVHLAVATRYGWFPDEFYFVICGRHLAWGYVDQPPLVPLLAHIAEAVPGGGLLTLRLFAIAAHVGCIVSAALLTAEFGGRRLAQVIAAAAVAACPAFVGLSMYFGPTVTDQLVWLTVLALVARALRLDTTPSWLLAGAAAGIGLENKHTAVVLIAGIAAGLVIFERETLRTPRPWLAAGLATLLAAPNLWWMAQHGWPNLQFARMISQHSRDTLGSLIQLPLLTIGLAGPLLVVLWVFGIRWLASPAQREHRWILVVVAVALVVFTCASGRPYYAAPVFAVLYAAGAVRVESARTVGLQPNSTDENAWLPLRWTATLAVSFVGAVLLCLPVLPISAAQALRHINPWLASTYGWPQFTKQVVTIASSLPAHVPIFTGYYTEAGALSILGPAADLRHPVYSAHNNYALWGPPKGSPDTVLCVGDFPRSYLLDYWSQVSTLATVTADDGEHTWETDRTIYLCQQPRGTWAEMWPSLSHFH